MQWHSLNNNNETARESDTACEIIEEPIQACAFCRGKGEKPAGSQCSVCRGKGTVEIRPPAVKCALCKGRGEERPRGNVTCNACRGKGYISVTLPIQKCASCRGTGRQRGSRLACITCRGAGVVSIAPRKTGTVMVTAQREAPRPVFTLRIGEQPSTGDRRAAVASAAVRRAPSKSASGAGVPAVAASELEILRLYVRASLTGERIVLSEASRRTPAYVKLLQESLIKKGLLRRTDLRKLQVTDRGMQVVRKRGGVETVKDSSRLAARESEIGNERDLALVASPENSLRWATIRGIVG